VPALLAGVKAGCVRLCLVASNIVWCHMESDFSRSSEMGFLSDFFSTEL